MNTDANFEPGFTYFMATNDEGLAVGETRGLYRLYRVWRRTDGKLIHYCIAVMPSAIYAVMLIEFLDLYMDLTFGEFSGYH